MKQYWMRIAGAWLLLAAAGKVMRSAEQVLQAASDTPPVEPAEPDATLNGTAPDADMVTDYVDARYDG